MSLQRQMLAQLPPGKQPSRTSRNSDVIMAYDLIVRDVIALLQKVYQLRQRFILGRGRLVMFEIPYQADADGMFIPVIVIPGALATMSPGFLVLPAIAHFHLPVRSASAVIDDKMVAQSIPVFLLVIGVDNPGIARLPARMMHDYPLPALNVFPPWRRYPIGGHIIGGRGRPV